MKNVAFTLDKAAARAPAAEYFMDICGLYRRRDISPALVDEGLAVLNGIFDEIEIRALYSEYGSGAARGGILDFDGVVFSCPVLSQPGASDIRGVVIYLLSVGDIEFKSERPLHQVYHDMWLTAFVDAGRDLLKEHVKNSLDDKSLAVSDAFAPGFSGMPAQDTEKFFQILEAGMIGTSVRPDGLMMPVKSYAGFFLVTGGMEIEPLKDCDSCLSSRKTCSYCKTGRRRAEESDLELMRSYLRKREADPS